jgi:hypothetical protein
MEAFMRNVAESKLVGTWENLSTNSKWPSWGGGGGGGKGGGGGGGGGGQCVLGGREGGEDPKRLGTWESF